MKSLTKITIDAGRSSGLQLKELLQYRDLFLTLSFRDFKVRYAQTFLGLAWAFIQPLITLIILTLIFGRVLKVDTGGVPFPVYALSGLCAWTYFAFVMSQAGQSIIGAQSMVQKVFFPRLIIPLSKALTGLVEYGVTLVFLASLMIYYKIGVSWNILGLIPLTLVLIIGALGVGIWLSAISVRYRDFQHVAPFLVQIGLYASPVAYPASFVQGKLELILYLNPMTGIIDAFRWSILGTPVRLEMLAISAGMLLVIFVTSLFYFKKVEKEIADIL